MSTATVLRDHNSNNCTPSGNICCCTYVVINDYDKFRSLSRLYMTLFRHRTCTYYLHGRSDRFLVSVSLQWPGGSTQWLGLLSIGFARSRHCHFQRRRVAAAARWLARATWKRQRRCTLIGWTARTVWNWQRRRWRHGWLNCERQQSVTYTNRNCRCYCTLCARVRWRRHTCTRPSTTGCSWNERIWWLR